MPRLLNDLARKPKRFTAFSGIVFGGERRNFFHPSSHADPGACQAAMDLRARVGRTLAFIG
jgi:hypothetical protein